MLITLTGTHRVTLPPERCTITVHLAFESDSQSEPMRRLETAVAEIEADLKELTSSPSTPITQFSIGAPSTRTWRPWNQDGDPLPLRHGAALDVRAQLRDFRALGQWVAAWGERDGCTVRSAEWTLTEETRRIVEASTLTTAIENARERAQLMATTAGFSRIEFVEIADPGLLDGPPETSAYMCGGTDGSAAGRVLMADDVGVTIAPEDIEVEATVHARFRAS